MKKVHYIKTSANAAACGRNAFWFVYRADQATDREEFVTCDVCRRALGLEESWKKLLDDALSVLSPAPSKTPGEYIERAKLARELPARITGFLEGSR